MDIGTFTLGGKMLGRDGSLDGPELQSNTKYVKLAAWQNDSKDDCWTMFIMVDGLDYNFPLMESSRKSPSSWIRLTEDQVKVYIARFEAAIKAEGMDYVNTSVSNLFNIINTWSKE